MKLEFGIFAKPLSTQLFGRVKDKKSVEHFQKYSDAITRLGIAGLLTDAEIHKARIRLAKRISKEILKEQK